MTTGATADPRPLPLPDDVSAFYWDGARARRLLLQRCLRCSKLQYPPDVACVHCQSEELEPSEVSGRGRLWSYTVVDRVFHAGFADTVPYVVALIELEEEDGLRILTNIVDASPEDLRVGMAVEVTFEDRGDVVLPQFRPAVASS
ncbi:MAG: OB-fold domain-containing protein [Acidimicrobiia bacterium]|nr:OB-fold domain-containing protein [Acidimicrobiia bacterium]